MTTTSFARGKLSSHLEKSSTKTLACVCHTLKIWVQDPRRAEAKDARPARKLITSLSSKDSKESMITSKHATQITFGQPSRCWKVLCFNPLVQRVVLVQCEENCQLDAASRSFCTMTKAYVDQNWTYHHLSACDSWLGLKAKGLFAGESASMVEERQLLWLCQIPSLNDL